MSRLRSVKKSKVLFVSLSVLTALIVTAGLFVKVELTKAIDENAVLKQELSDLNEANARLEIEYESLIDLSELEEYAKTALGMQKPESERIIQIDVEVQDKAEILKDSAKTETDKLVSSIMEYLSELKCKFN